MCGPKYFALIVIAAGIGVVAVLYWRRYREPFVGLYDDQRNNYVISTPIDLDDLKDAALRVDEPTWIDSESSSDDDIFPLGTLKVYDGQDRYKNSVATDIGKIWPVVDSYGTANTRLVRNQIGIDRQRYLGDETTCTF